MTFSSDSDLAKPDVVQYSVRQVLTVARVYCCCGLVCHTVAAAVLQLDALSNL